MEEGAEKFKLGDTYSLWTLSYHDEILGMIIMSVWKNNNIIGMGNKIFQKMFWIFKLHMAIQNVSFIFSTQFPKDLENGH